MIFQKVTKIRDMTNQPVTLQHTINTDFLPYGLDMPYRIIVENKLVQVDKYDSTSTLTSTSTYSYDGFGNRVKKSVNGTVTYYIYDSEDIRFETDELGTITAEYTHGPGTDAPLSMKRNGNVYYYHVNGLGSITALTDSSKTVVQSYVYDSFGQIISQTGSIQNPYTYTGREYDSETGMYYYRARYYDAKMGRFISEDPIGFAGGDVNLYLMVGNNPVNYIDPEGFKKEDPGYGCGDLCIEKFRQLRGKDICDIDFYDTCFICCGELIEETCPACPYPTFSILICTDICVEGMNKRKEKICKKKKTF